MDRSGGEHNLVFSANGVFGVSVIHVSESRLLLGSAGLTLTPQV